MEKKLLKEEEKSVEKDSLLKLKFSKSSHLRKKSEFKAFNSLKNRLKGSYLIIDYRFNENISHPKFAIAISSKFFMANKRNKFKRQIREIFRLNQDTIAKNLELLIRVKSFSKNLKYQDLEKDFLNLILLVKK